MFKFTYKYGEEFTKEEIADMVNLLGENPTLKHKVTLEDTDEMMWPEVLQEFIKFMEKCYGYSISGSVAIAKPKSIHADISKWTGPVFNPNESL
jgi:hypothetical protein